MTDNDNAMALLATRAQTVGVELLCDTELLALVLWRGGTPDDEVPTARELLGEHRGLRGVARQSLGVLAPDVGFERAIRLLAGVELARRALSTPLALGGPYGTSRDVVRAFLPRMADANEERAVALVLDAQMRAVAEREVGRGDAESCRVTARTVFGAVLREGGEGVVMVHNHPSGDPTPSEDDVAFTRALVMGAKVLDLRVVDHVIIGRDGTFSFRDAGLLRRMSEES